MEPKIPLVSIGIPCFQREKFLEQTIASALHQSYRNIEIVISDNASTDSSASIAMRFASLDKRVRFFTQAENKGPTFNFEFVLRNATGEFFLWLGDDDWLDENYVETCLKCLLDNPLLSVCGGTPVYYKNGTPPFEGGFFDIRQSKKFIRVSNYLKQVSDNGIFYGLIRKNALDRAPIINCMGWDWILFSSLAFQGGIITNPETHVHRRLGGATTSFTQIVEVMRLPRWHARFPYLAITKELVSQVFSNPNAFSGMSFLARLAFSIGVSFCIFRYKTAHSIRTSIQNRFRGMVVRN